MKYSGVAGDDGSQPLSPQRRFALKAGLVGAAAAVATPGTLWAKTLGRKPGREIALFNLHTGEKLHAEYWRNGKYVPDAMHAVSVIMRDHHNNKTHPIDPHLLDIAHMLRARLGNPAPLQIVSGYRSPETNAMMHEMSSGVAVHSMHIEGKAVDIRLPGTHLPALRRAALSLRLGGVGYYPYDDFVHVDTGKIRRWVG